MRTRCARHMWWSFSNCSAAERRMRAGTDRGCRMRGWRFCRERRTTTFSCRRRWRRRLQNFWQRRCRRGSRRSFGGQGLLGFIDPRLASKERTRTWGTQAGGEVGKLREKTFTTEATEKRPEPVSRFPLAIDMPLNGDRHCLAMTGFAEVFIAVGMKDVRADQIAEHAAHENV